MGLARGRPRAGEGDGDDLQFLVHIDGGWAARAQAFSWLHDAAWMGGWWRYRAADRCGGCGCDLAAVLGGLVLVVTRRCVTGHAGSDRRDADGRCRMRCPRT